MIPAPAREDQQDREDVLSVLPLSFKSLILLYFPSIWKTGPPVFQNGSVLFSLAGFRNSRMTLISFSTWRV